jgi:hypothetical protein
MTANPTKIDRIEAAHWARTAAHGLKSWTTAIESFEQFPTLTYEKAVADLDGAIRLIENAKKALRGQHTRGAGSLLEDLGK